MSAQSNERSGSNIVPLSRTELARVAPNYEAMRTAIEQCAKVDEIAELANKATAAQAYFRQSQDVDNEMECSRMRLRAERRMGELLRIMAQSGERATRQTAREIGSSSAAQHDRPTLSDLGIPRDRASRAMQLAEVPQEQFDAALGQPEVAQPRRILSKLRAPAASEASAVPITKGLEMLAGIGLLCVLVWCVGYTVLALV